MMSMAAANKVCVVVMVLVLLGLSVLVEGSTTRTSLMLVSGTVSCPECTHKHPLAGIRVLIKCTHGVWSTALTNNTGWFEAELPSSESTNGECFATLASGPTMKCQFKGGHVSKIVNGRLLNQLTLSPGSCIQRNSRTPSPRKMNRKTGQMDDLGASKTIDLPVPHEWGIAPTSYYFYPFIPIGIP